ncbi:type II toxin-antitoxin system HicA family toxin [Pelistega suis]|uniref:Type II toxin-antitoxin system HicA family toxin n=1 Tax=Pelistega suis TaxID=1631957 RepID=A0A849P7H8_9BURK|nr:type II toxin-antitoxin system HicA family toxin [Pelistega suis]NOL51498.1 type II toxin-antitoxin system HicA family toxin [Pelistega suis]
MRQSEFLRWFLHQGVSTSQGSNHIKLYYKGKQSVMPRHPAKELATGTVEAIKKQLGLK